MQPQDSSDPYGFITNPQSTPKRRINFGNTPRQRIIIVGVGFILLIIIFIVLSSLFSRASNAQKDRLIELAQTQTEIIRIASLADKESSDINTRALAINTKLTLETDLQETNKFLAKRAVKLKNKTLKLKQDEKTDKTLEEAAANNQFDNTFVLLLQDQLDNYRGLVKSAYEEGGRSEKQALRQNYDELALLL